MTPVCNTSQRVSLSHLFLEIGAGYIHVQKRNRNLELVYRSENWGISSENRDSDTEMLTMSFTTTLF